MPKGRKRSPHKGRTRPFEKLTQRQLWAMLIRDPRRKLFATGTLALVVLPLIVLFSLGGDTNALYVLVLASGSLGLFLWALPKSKLGLTAIFLFTQPLLIYLGNSEYGYTKAVYSLGFISLLAILWAIEIIQRGPIRLQLTHLSLPGLLILIATLLSLINGQTLLGDLQYVVLLVYFWLFYLWLANTLIEPQEIRFLLGALLLSAVLASLYGLLQYYGVLPGTPSSSGGVSAIISTFGNKNYLGGFLAYLVAPGLVLLLGARSSWIKSFALVAVGLIAVTLLAIDSDSAWLASALSLAVWLLGVRLLRGMDLLREQWRWGAALAAGVAIFTLGFLLTTVVWVQGAAVGFSSIQAAISPFSPLAWGGLALLILIPVIPWLEKLFRSHSWGWLGRAALGLALLLGAFTPLGQGLVQTLYQQALKSSANVRAWDWWVGYEMFKDQPIVGVGLGDYKREFLPYKAEFLATERGQYYAQTVGYIVRAAQAHNEYVQIMAEMGLMGLLATALLLATLFWSAICRLRASPSWEHAGLIIGLFAGIVAFMSDSIFSFPLHLPANALVLIFLLGALHSRAVGRESLVISLGGRSSHLLAAGLILVALTVSYLAYRDWRADLYLDLGTRLLKEGDLSGAQAAFEQSLRWDLTPAESLYWLGLIAYQQGDLERSRELFTRALPVFVTENIYFYLALIEERLGERAAAQKYLDQLLALDPEPSLKLDARQLQALLWYKQGRIPEALQQIQRLFEESGSPRMLATLGQMQAEQGQLEEARKSFQAALALVNERLSQLEEILAPGKTLPLDSYYRLRSEQESLKQLQKTIEENLKKLPSSD